MKIVSIVVLVVSIVITAFHFYFWLKGAPPKPQTAGNLLLDSASFMFAWAYVVLLESRQV